jgi:predicted GH43/DUF377 family glycosyl hydrolase
MGIVNEDLKSTASSMGKSALGNYKLLNNTLLLSGKAKIKNRDDLMATEINAILLLSPPNFWKTTIYLGDMFNPALENWQNKNLFTWRRKMYNSPIDYAFLSFEKLLSLPATNHTSKGERDIFESLLPDVSMKQFRFNRIQEDPRLLARKDGSLLILYTAKESYETPSKQGYSIATMNSAQQIKLSDSVLLDGHSMSPGQKNWIPLEYQDELYFIQSVNPLVVLKHITTDEKQVGKLEIVYEGAPLQDLPWGDKYGSIKPSIRGGTPAIMVKGRYLAFFHSVTHLQENYKMRTYFMGAISFCPTLPFRVHSISTHPILQDRFYEGPWVWKNVLDYVMFAIGLVIDPKDSNFVWVSFGHQDKHSYVAKLHVDELYASLEDVSEC